LLWFWWCFRRVLSVRVETLRATPLPQDGSIATGSDFGACGRVRPWDHQTQHVNAGIRQDETRPRRENQRAHWAKTPGAVDQSRLLISVLDKSLRDQPAQVRCREPPTNQSIQLHAEIPRTAPRICSVRFGQSQQFETAAPSQTHQIAIFMRIVHVV
jgi:hypothetical protein